MAPLVTQESRKGLLVYMSVSEVSSSQMAWEPGRGLTWISTVVGGGGEGSQVHPGRGSGTLLPSDNEERPHPCLWAYPGVSR